MGEKGVVWWRTVLMKGYDSSYSAMTGHRATCAVCWGKGQVSGGGGGGGGMAVVIKRYDNNRTGVILVVTA